jgi:hypothetical protein
LKHEKNELPIAPVKKIIDEIFSIIRTEDKNNNFIVISDNNYVKKIMKHFFPTFIILMHDITHFGEGTILETNKIKNTMLDFYIMALSKKIFSFSTYVHGSGFSQWCAETYNVPYSCKLVKI